MKVGGYRVLPNSLRSANVHKHAQKTQQTVQKHVSKLFPGKTTTVSDATNAGEPSLEDKIDKLFSGQDMLFERLHSEPKWHSKAYSKAQAKTRDAAVFVRKQPLVAKIAIVLVPLAVGGLVAYIYPNSSDKKVQEVAGVTDKAKDQGSAPKDLVGVKPSFKLLLPKGKTESQITFAKVSPEGNAPVYAYLDQVGKTQIKISQQVIPDQFKYNPDAELKRVAEGFQAADIIQIDKTTVYHGLNDKTKIQSLVFIKNDRLVFIASPDKLTDDEWTGYILNLL